MAHIWHKILTDRQYLFCFHYIFSLSMTEEEQEAISINPYSALKISRFINNATRTYQKIYSCTYETARANSSRLLNNEDIKRELYSMLQYKRASGDYNGSNYKGVFTIEYDLKQPLKSQEKPKKTKKRYYYRRKKYKPRANKEDLAL